MTHPFRLLFTLIFLCGIQVGFSDGEITTTAKELGITKYAGVSDGPSVADWSLEAVLPEYAKRCAKFISDQAGKEKPFFLYFPMPSPHTPIAPDENWKGKSGISDYADFLLETDWAIGELLRALTTAPFTGEMFHPSPQPINNS